MSFDYFGKGTANKGAFIKVLYSDVLCDDFRIISWRACFPGKGKSMGIAWSLLLYIIIGLQNRIAASPTAPALTSRSRGKRSGL